MITFSIKRFSELTVHELYSIIKLRQDIFVIEQQCIYEDCDGKDIESLHVLGLYDSEIVAYCRILPKGLSYDSYCAIGRVLTSATSRKNGFGRQLMIHAIDYCETHFKENIKISAQHHLEPFYQSLGFDTISEVYLEDDIPHVAMVREKKVD